MESQDNIKGFLISSVEILSTLATLATAYKFMEIVHAA